MNTHKAVNTITTAPVAKDVAEIDRLQKPGARVEVKTLNPGDHFDPSAHGMTAEEVTKLESSGKIAKLEGADVDAAGRPIKRDAEGRPIDATGRVIDPATGLPIAEERGNRTEGSGATGLGTKQTSPAGVDSTGKAGPQQAGGVGSNLPPGTTAGVKR